MKKILFLLCCVVSSLHASADDYNYLVFTATDGTETSFATGRLKITFSDGMLVASNADGTQRFVITDLSKMYFSSTTTAVGHVETAVNDAPVTVYTVTGVKLGVFDSADAARQQLKSGIYLFKTKLETHKTIVP